MVIPKFPDFRILTLSDRSKVNRITKNYPPYSDFNFMSLWSYNIEGDARISMLNNNLAIEFRDYLTKEKFYTFLGKTNINHTILSLLDLSKKNGYKEQLSLIPQIVIDSSADIYDRFVVLEDRDNFDYIYSTKKMSEMEGSLYTNKRNKVKRFTNSYPQAVTSVHLHPNSDVSKKLIKLFKIWEVGKQKTNDEVEIELTALNRLLEVRGIDSLYFICVTIEDKLIACSVVELDPAKFATFHFTKADPTYHGVFEFLYLTVATFLYKKGYTSVSREQDLGIPGLRIAKTSWNPEYFLKKYTIKNK